MKTIESNKPNSSFFVEKSEKPLTYRYYVKDVSGGQSLSESKRRIYAGDTDRIDRLNSKL